MRRFPIWTVRHPGNGRPLIDVVLENRSLLPEDVTNSPEVLEDPFEMKGMKPLMDRLLKAITEGERIVVFGDYDVDGVTSTALLLDFFARVGADATPILPNRARDGYGMKPPGVRRALDAGAQLIITADNGISSFEAIRLAAESGVDVLIIDHHHPQDRLPEARSIVNPNQRDCPYAFKGLAAVGVAFKVVQAATTELMEKEERKQYLNSILDLVALGTVADVAPMVRENRLMTRRGLQILSRGTRPGLEALKGVAGQKRKVDATSIAFFLGPRINSAGRLASPDLSLDLLRAPEHQEAQKLAEELDALNTRRQELQETGTQEAEEQVEVKGYDHHRILVVKGKDWHLGVVGLISGRLTERYNRPSVACTEVRNDGTFTGSARSTGGYNIVEGIFRCADVLTEYRGHADAAGFTGPSENYAEFKARLEEDADRHLSEDDLRPELEIDAVIKPAQASLPTILELEELAPFGPGNESPVFMMDNCVMDRIATVGGDSHLKLWLLTAGGTHEAIWWRHGHLAEELKVGDRVDVAFTLDVNEWNGYSTVQLVVEDVRKSEIGDER